MGHGWNQMTPRNDLTEHSLSLSLSLSQCGVIVKKKHWSDEKLYGEQHYRKMADSLTDTHTQREVRENDLVFKATCFLIWRSCLSEVTLTVCLWGDATIAVQPRHYSLSLSLFLSLSSQELPSFTLSLSMHSTAEVDQRFVCLCYNYAQKWYSRVQICIIHCLLDVSVHLTMHKQKR